MEDTGRADALLQLDIVVSVVHQLYDDLTALKSMKRTCKPWSQVLRDDEGLWQELVKRRFGRKSEGMKDVPPGCPLGPWQAQYVRGSPHQIALSDPDRSCVVWGDTSQYFSKTSHQLGAISRTCMQLRNVCWLQVQSSFKGVTAGKYAVLWRMKLDRDAGRLYGLAGLYMDAHVVSARDDGGHVLGTQFSDPPHVGGPTGYSNMMLVVPDGRGEIPRLEVEPGQPGAVDMHAPEWDGVYFKHMLPRDVLLRYRNVYPLNDHDHEWINIQAGVLEVPSGHVYDIGVRMFDTSGQWKQGITWDVVTLVPIVAGSEGTLCPHDVYQHVQGGEGSRELPAPSRVGSLVQAASSFINSTLCRVFGDAAGVRD